MKQKKLVMGCILIVGAAATLFLGKRELANAYFSTVKLQFLTNYMDGHYLYDIDEQIGLDGIYEGYLQGVENNGTYYLNTDELIAEKTCAEGNYFGTGLKLMWRLDGHALVVTGVIPNSAADREGIKAGDCITNVGGIPVLPANQKDITDQVTSRKKQLVEYIIERDQAVMSIDLSPDKVILDEYESEVIEGVLYIKMNSIKEETSHRLSETVNDYMIENDKGIILDVRDLQTDKVEQINKICDLFLTAGVSFKIQTKTEGVKTFTTNGEAVSIPLTVIINSGTLGGSEALVAALKERATLVGSDTGGFVYIKQIFTFEDKTGMSVATGIICDQYGEALSKEGISPDIRVYLDEEDRMIRILEGYVDKQSDPFLSAALEVFQ